MPNKLKLLLLVWLVGAVPLIVAAIFGPLAALALFAALYVLGWCVRAWAWLDDFARRDRARRERHAAAEDAQPISVRSDRAEPAEIAILRIRFALLAGTLLPFGVAGMGAMLLPVFAQFLDLRTAIAFDAALYAGSMLAVVIYAVPMLAAQLSETP